MGGFDHLLAPFLVVYLLANIPPTLLEILAYYQRGGLCIWDFHADATWHPYYTAYTDWWIYFKRYCDRPNTEAAKAFYAYLDWSAAAWDKSIYMHRRTMAKGAGETHKWRVDIYGPFRFNWKQAHNKQWLRGDDAAGYKFPIWGDGGEERARTEYTAAKEQCFDHYWHYQIPKKVKKAQLAKAAEAAAKAEASSE
jgi:hypothetical protein